MNLCVKSLLQEEYNRVLLTISAYEREASALPKGHITVKRIKNHEYNYLQWREGKKTRSQYIRKEDIEELRKQIERRNHLVSSLRDMRKAEKEFQKVLGREL